MNQVLKMISRNATMALALMATMVAFVPAVRAGTSVIHLAVPTEGITSDKNGNIFFSAVPLGEIWKFAPGGVPEFFARLGAGAPLGMKADHNGSIYAVFRTGPDGQIWHVNKHGRKSLFASIPGGGQINDLAIAPNGVLYVTDSFKGKIYRVRNNGDVSQWLDHPFLKRGLCPHPLRPAVNGIAVGENGDVYLCNSTRGSIIRVPVLNGGAAGTPEEIAGPDCDLVGADGILFGEDGSLYVGLNIQNKVVRITWDGDGHALTEEVANSDDGLRFPATLAWGPGGDLYVANVGLLFPPGPPPRAPRIVIIHRE